jgi:hypothetical protein
MTRTSIIAISVALMSLAGCRGQTSTEPPIHLNPNMDIQPKYKAQSRSAFFADGRTMRTPPQGTVMQGHLREDDAVSEGDEFRKLSAVIGFRGRRRSSRK